MAFKRQPWLSQGGVFTDSQGNKNEGSRLWIAFFSKMSNLIFQLLFL